MPAYIDLSRDGRIFLLDGLNKRVSIFDTTDNYGGGFRSPNGIYLKQVTLSQKILEFKNGKIYSIVSTEEGFRTIKRFKPEEKKE